MYRLNALRIGGVVVCFAFVLTAAASVGFAQTDPHAGTWVLNLEKSKYAPGTAPKSQTTVFTADGKGIKVVTNAVTASGPSTTEYTATFDGKDHPVKGNADWDTTALKRVDARTIEFTRKKGGKVVQTATVGGRRRRQDAHRDRDRRERAGPEGQHRRVVHQAVNGCGRADPASLRSATAGKPSARLRRLCKVIGAIRR